MLTFKRNMCLWDRLARTTVGAVLWLTGPVFNVWNMSDILVITFGVLGTMAILSAVFAYCMLYEFAGMNTLKK